MYVISNLGKKVLYADYKRMLNMIAVTEKTAEEVLENEEN